MLPCAQWPRTKKAKLAILNYLLTYSFSKILEEHFRETQKVTVIFIFLFLYLLLFLVLVSVLVLVLVLVLQMKKLGTWKRLHTYCIIFAKGSYGNCEAFAVHNSSDINLLYSPLSPQRFPTQPKLS